MGQKLIVGADRGIALEMAKQLKERGDEVIAVTLNDGADAEALGVKVISKINVTSDTDVARLADELKAAGAEIDWLVHVAGIMHLDTIETLDFDDCKLQFDVNTLGPLRTVRALRDFLAEGSKVGIVTSRVGSLADNGSGNDYAYRISKAAANVVAINLHHDLKKVGVHVQALHPGTVATNLLDVMSDADKEKAKAVTITPEDSAKGLIRNLDNLTAENAGRFQHANGDFLPW